MSLEDMCNSACALHLGPPIDRRELEGMLAGDEPCFDALLPEAVVENWPLLSFESRVVAYLCNNLTHYYFDQSYDSGLDD